MQWLRLPLKLLWIHFWPKENPFPIQKPKLNLHSTRSFEFDSCKQTTLSAPQGCSLTAYAAGHSLGAALWKVALRAGEDFVYALDFNHKKERHIDGIALESINRPSLLICSSDRIFCPHRNKKQRDASFVESCLTPLRAGGSVLVASKVATRALEILLLVEQTWAANKYLFPVFFLGPCVNRVVEWAKSMLEWMGEGVIKAFGINRANPLAFKHIIQQKDWRSLPPGPKVVITWDASLHWGPAKELLLHGNWASHPENTILLTCDHSSYLQLKTGTWNCTKREKIPLEGDELKAWKQQQIYQLQKQQADAAFEALMQRRKRQEFMGGCSDLLAEEDSQAEEQEQLNEQQTGQEASKSSDLQSAGGSSSLNSKLLDERERLKRLYWYDYQYDCLGSDAKFPLRGERRVKVDEYGEAIDDLISALSLNASPLGSSSDEKSPDYNHHHHSSSSTKEAQSSSCSSNNFPDDEAPHKWLDHPFCWKIACKVGYLDFEGLSDGRSLKTVIGRMNPRRLAIVGGTECTRQYMLQMCRISEEIGGGGAGTGGSGSTLVVALDNGTLSVPIPQGKGIGQRNVRVDEEVLSALQVAKCGDYEVAFLRGSLVQEGNKISPFKRTVDDDEQQKLKGRDPVLVGNVKLAQLKRDVLSFAFMTTTPSSASSLKLSNGHLPGEGGLSVELAAGQLTVMQEGSGEKQKLDCVKKTTGHKIGIEGVLGVEYWMVRDALYSQLVAV